MNETHLLKIASETQIQPRQILATARLFEEGATVPFIARYRKEATGNLDEVQIIAIRDRLEQLKELDARREAILKSLKEQNKLTDDLLAKVMAAETLSKLEDIYLPYRPKRRTRGMMAKEKGLEPLASVVFAQGEIDPDQEAAKYVSAEKEVPDTATALAGARDIIAEWINEDAEARAEIRELFKNESVLRSKVILGKEDEGAKYRDYFDWSEPLAQAPSHRVLAIRRGANEGFLTFRLGPEEERGIEALEKRFVQSANAASRQVGLAVTDCYKRLMALSMETEMRLESKKSAEADAIVVFAENLRNLLLASPLGQKAVLGVDPGLRTGCKIVCLNQQGKLLEHCALYPLAPHNRVEEAEAAMKILAQRHSIEAIAVGNGTGGREALSFVKGIDFGRQIPAVMVSESGASVYSASEVAREEFPNEDLTVRGAVSIGRRLMDPLAELVKIDPKSIGVGQYQHDVDQRALKKSLDDVVVSCVNGVGVEINTASKQLISYVAGLSDRIAEKVVERRDQEGPFKSRKELLKVAGMGPKTFEQAAGFMRIRGGENPLDASAVHPESYPIVEKMAADLGRSVSELMSDAGLRSQIQLENYVTDSVGLPTLKDIMAELAKPGRDPREPFEMFSFTEGVNEMTDLKPGMKLPGVVTNVAAFGAFVDIGVHQDGLVHISELSDNFVSNPHDVVKVQQKVQVTVMEVDLPRKRISLSMKTQPGHRVSSKPAAQEGTSGNRDRRDQGGRRGGNTGGRSGGGAARPPKQREAPSNNPFEDLLKDWNP